MPKASGKGAKIKVSSVKYDKNLDSKAGWNRMRLRWLISERIGSENGVLGHTTFPPGASHEPHVHEKAEEYIIITKGKAFQTVGNRAYRAKEGDVIFVPKNTVHSTRNSSKTSEMSLFFMYAGAPSIEKTGYRRVSKVSK